jgi:hypothetical protein
MKTTKKFLVMLVATLLMATNVWAGDVVVIKKLNGKVNNNVGTVTPLVKDGVCTVTVTPNDGYYIDAVTAEKTVSGDIAQARGMEAPAMDNFLTVTATDADADPSGETTWTFTMPSSEYDVEVVANFKQRTSISTAVITLSLPQDGYSYDGQAKTPAVSSVKLNNNTINSDNYDVSYSNKINAGTATVTVTGKRTYTGTATTTFAINKAPLSDLAVLVPGWTYGLYNLEVNAPRVSGNTGSGAVTITYKAAGASTFTSTVPQNAGTHTVKAVVAETDNYAAGEATSEFTIAKADIQLVVSIDNWTYGDEAKAPSVTGNSGNGTVTYTYANTAAPSLVYESTVPSAAGSYSVKAVVPATTNYNGGEATASFTIAKADFSQVAIADIADQTYTDSQITPAVTVTFKGKAVDASEYTVSYGENKNVGEGTVTLASTDVNFSPAEVNPTKTFQIVPASAVITAQNQTVTYNGDSQLFTSYSVTNGEVGVAYFATEADRTAGDNQLEVVSDAGTYYVQLTQVDENYTSEPVDVTFTIEAKSLDESMIWHEADEFIYSGEAQTLDEMFGLTDEELETDLVYGEDYTISYANNVNVGTATATITGMGNYQGTLTYDFKIVREMNIAFSETNAWASYYAEEDLQIPAGLKAYIVKSVTGNSVVVDEVTYIPQHEGVLLTYEEVAPEDAIFAEAYTGATQEFANLLLGCSETTAVETLTADGSSIYVLYNDEFVKTTKGSIKPFRCYLELGAEVAAAEGRLSIVEDNDVTALKLVNSEERIVNSEVYDLQGRKVNQPAKGLYILNGKKVVIKK